MSEAAYLTAKRSVDDRALDRRVLDAFVRALNDRTDSGRIELLEVGAGTGTMIARLATREGLPATLDYRAVDRNADHVAHARTRLPAWLADVGYSVEQAGNQLVATTPSSRIEVHLEIADAFSLDAEVDAVVAMAFLDLVDLPEALVALADDLRPAGILYAPITFDGGTGFAPRHQLDERIVRAYHRHMAEVREGGSPDTGQRLLEAITGVGGELLAVGGSSQVISPLDGAYPGRERLVLEHLLETVADAVAAIPESQLSTAELEEWVTARRSHLDDRTLSFVAHNLDVLARF